ncbi:hypothetical protein [Nonomuraea soli]|uniref:Secreted protein n=1 Tax=Nonomuraea soli TaxID=1032476 RepID=A0A7W0CET6_9ACTN|nr:hypothetical protein [Nonomuraea soli]MBA2889842.1 hypothetical protein [Nonomuraea soli]
MSPIELGLTLLAIFLLLFLVLGGLAVFFMVKLGRKAAVKARDTATRLSAHVNAMGTGEAAEVERLRLDLRREVGLTRQGIEQAQRQGWGLGELPEVFAELTRQADIQDTQLGMYAAQRRTSPYVDHVTLERLREHQAKLTAICARIRADLMSAQMHHATSGIDELGTRTDLELEARRRTVDPLDEIDELYRRAMQDKHDPPVS